MKDFWKKLTADFRRFMAQRYGNDAFGSFLFVLYLILSVLLSLFHIRSLVVQILVYVPCILYLYRFFSRDLQKRRTENQQFLNVWQPLNSRLRKKAARLGKMKEYRYFKCPYCRSELRVPRGKGAIVVTCPKCRHTFDKRS